MTRTPTFPHLCSLLLVSKLYRQGHSVAEIARAAKVSASTVRRWLDEVGVPRRHHHKE